MTTLCLADLDIELFDKKVESKGNESPRLMLIQTLKGKPEAQRHSEESLLESNSANFFKNDVAML